jgi:hypothetical protein
MFTTTKRWVKHEISTPPHTLVFDTTLSSHYKVFLIPIVPAWADLDHQMQASQWPPSLFETHVFSSKTCCWDSWEERSFVREGELAGTMADMQRARMGQKHYDVYYWRGTLYVHCQNDFFCRISTLNGTYQVIKLPIGIVPNQNPELYLGRSENGVYTCRERGSSPGW